MSETKRPSLFKKAGDLLRKFDHFGESASFQIKGESTENTICGSLVSIAIIVLTFSYAVRRFQVLRDYQDTTHILTDWPDTNNARELTQAESGFNFAFGFISSLTLLPGRIDTHGFIEFTVVKNEWSAGVDETTGESSLNNFVGPAAMRDCTLDDLNENFYVAKPSQQYFIEQMLPNMKCF